MDVREEFIPEVPEMLLRLDSSANSIKGEQECLLTLWGNGPIVSEGLESLPVFALEASSSSCFQPVHGGHQLSWH